jgi:hypothetical protein
LSQAEHLLIAVIFEPKAASRSVIKAESRCPIVIDSRVDLGMSGADTASSSSARRAGDNGKARSHAPKSRVVDEAITQTNPRVR